MSQYAKRLDRSRDFGTYHGSSNGAVYNQDGFDFDQEGRIVEALLTDEQKKLLATKKGPAPKPPAPAAKVEAPAEEKPEPPPASEDTGDSLNLEMWLRGEADYPFPAVQKAVKERFSVWKTARRDLLVFLVDEQKVVTSDELCPDLKNVIG